MLKIGLTIGIGGGSKIDLAKKIAYDLNVPFISVPTAPSHDGKLMDASNNKRTKAIISVFLYTGVRVSELSNLMINDVDFDKYCDAFEYFFVFTI